jgi:hypothetical protein
MYIYVNIYIYNIPLTSNEECKLVNNVICEVDKERMLENIEHINGQIEILN